MFYNIKKRSSIKGGYVMRTIFLTAGLLCMGAGLIPAFVSGLHAEEVTVFDYKNGQYRYYDVERSNGSVDVYDWKDGTYRYYDVDERSGSIYDYQKNKYYDLDMDRDGDSGTVYDYETGSFYDFEIGR